MEGKLYILRAVQADGKITEYVTDEAHLQDAIEASACQEEMPHEDLYLFEAGFCLNGYLVATNYLERLP